MSEPTKEQIKELWEQCGVTKLKYLDGSWCFELESGIFVKLHIDSLDDLFKYAVPKLRSLGYGINMVIFSKLDLVSVALGKGKYEGQTVIHFQCEDKDLALALFRVIFKAFEASI